MHAALQTTHSVQGLVEKFYRLSQLYINTCIYIKFRFVLISMVFLI